MSPDITNIHRSYIKITKTIFYVILFSYLAGSIYIGLTYEKLVIKIGIFTFFLFIKKWAIFGFSLLVLLWVIENLHIFILKKRIKEFKEENN